MNFRTTICPACSRDIQVPADVAKPSCPYCGAGVTAEGAAPGASVATLMGMAGTAEIAGNQVEALSYYNRALEADPRNSDAWIGKGKAAGWQSTLANIRVAEMLVAFGHALSNAPPETSSATLNRVTDEANSLIVTIYGMARNHLVEFASTPNVWSDYVGQMGMMIDALETVHSWNPTDSTTLENIVHICKDNIEGLSYRDQFNGNSPGLYSLSPEYEKHLRSRLEDAANKLNQLIPGYSAPTVEKQKMEECFVITATVGDRFHPDVTFLQFFRDSWLRERRWGRTLIKFYYHYGPVAASFISKQRIYQTISKKLVVRPTVMIARFLMRL